MARPHNLLHGSELLTIELKAEKGRVSPEQRVVGDVIQRAGGRWAVCRSLEEVSARPKNWGRDWPVLPHQRIFSAAK